jgi:hypothetical protein
VPGINGQTVPTVGRIDMQRVAERRGRSGAGPPAEYPIGGIAYLLSNLLSRYEFSAGRPLTHQGLPALIVRGHLRPSPSPERSENDDDQQAPEEMMGLMPGAVTLVVGQQDLFPFVIQYHRAIDLPGSSRHDRESDDGTPIMTIEYYEVDFPASLDPRLFMYHAGEIAIQDDTEEFLQSW